MWAGGQTSDNDEATEIHVKRNDVTQRATSATTPEEPREKPWIPSPRPPSPGSLLPTGWEHHPAAVTA